MNSIAPQPLWYKDAVIYQLNLKTFADSNEDGIGDFPGLTNKLDYLQNLGVTALWLLPFYPSPLRDDGYDISDYFSIHKSYGTLKDFKIFLKCAHQRGLRIITELVLNHTSDQHRWFQESRRAKFGTRWRDFYVWSDSPHVYPEARIIFKDFETSNWTWDPVGEAYYWHRFYSHQPDLNFHNPAVREMMFKVIDFWLEMGVDGLRLDAVPYLFEKEGTNCENLPETHDFLKQLRAHIDANYSDRILLAEANQWPEDAAKYFGQGDECHMAFHFPLMPRIYMALDREDRYPIVDILEQTPTIPQTAQWALFLRNHDELTLEMVTDEERDYMYRVFAKDQRARINLGIRRRLAPLLGNNRRKIELLSTLLLSMPGTPIIYYGDEIGMGDNIYLGDRNGVRTPMQWSADKNAGFSRANPQQLFLPIIIDPEYHYEAVNVELQERNPSSLLWWMHRLIAQRKHFKSFGRGNIRFLNLDNNKVLAFTRTYEEETILVLINLSRFLQVAELQLSDYVGYTPEEVFSHNKLPVIRDAPFVITLGPFDHLWLLLSDGKRKEIFQTIEPFIIKEEINAELDEIIFQHKLETQILPHYLPNRRWFGSKTRTISRITIYDRIGLNSSDTKAHAAELFLIEVFYLEGSSDLFVLPLQINSFSENETLAEFLSQAILARWEKTSEKKGILIDAIASDEFRRYLLNFILNRKKLEGTRGKLIGRPAKTVAVQYRQEKLPQTSQLLTLDQSNSAFVYENKFFLKLYRHIQEGINPDVEMNRYLSEAKFTHIPNYAGTLEYVTDKGENFSLAILQTFVANEGNAWDYAQGAFSRFLERVLSERENLPVLEEEKSISDKLYLLLEGVFLQHIRLLGQRTAELHLILGQETDQLEFSPEPFTQLYQRSLYQSLYGQLKRQQRLVTKQLPQLEESIRLEAEKFLRLGDEISSEQQELLHQKIVAQKIRIHGDYHLGQVLFTGKDFLIIDFEGEPARPIGERRMKRSPLYDVAGMLRSFDYVAFSTFLQSRLTLPQDRDFLKGYVVFWADYVSGAFLESYLKTLGASPLIPQNIEALQLLLKILMLDKALYELSYELNNRPSWFSIPLLGIERLVHSKNITEKLPQILKGEFSQTPKGSLPSN